MSESAIHTIAQTHSVQPKTIEFARAALQVMDLRFTIDKKMVRGITRFAIEKGNSV